MKTAILDLKVIDSELEELGSTFSFEPFVQYLEKQVQQKSVKAPFFESLISKFTTDLAGRDEPGEVDSSRYKELFELIYLFLTPLVSAETQHLWALASPVPSIIYFGTDAFYNFHHTEPSCSIAGAFDANNFFSNKQKAFIYRLILQKFYNISSGVNSDTFLQGSNHQTGQPIYYKIHIDTRFLQITSKIELPHLNADVLESWLQESYGETHLESVLPLSQFEITGFSILEFTDVTEEHAIETLKNIIVEHSESNFFRDFNKSLQSLLRNRDLNFGLLPFLQVNGKTVYANETCSNSMLMNAAIEHKISPQIFHLVAEQHKSKPEVLIFNGIASDKTEKHGLLKVLRNSQIHSLALVPVFYQKNMVGVLEIYSKEKVSIDKVLLSPLQGAMPFIGQLLKQVTDEFSSTIENEVRDHYTSLKSSVKWKFNETIWNHLQASKTDPTAKTEKIIFSELYPFYGAIDIRQSTVERNKAVFEDISLQIDFLGNTLQELEKHLDPFMQKQFEVYKPVWINRFKQYRKSADELTIMQLIDTKIHPFLVQAEKQSEEAARAVRYYFQSASESEGILYKNRRELEISMQTVNNSINQYLDTHQKVLQNIFPHYFEKFRTDGIEYDIYLGQSISPGKKFDSAYKKQFRLWQLKSMAEIAVTIRNLSKELPKPLQTTQLIFVHSTPITISFRDDEKRFDVEGGYSIRYQVVKKRIDKVLIKGTDQRLTEPGKIAIVYFTEAEKEEYLEYIQLLQIEGYLDTELEFLELDDLQGVQGLKALRVGVR
jgi:hypothetical protein